MEAPSFDLSQKVAVITGASRGIGLAIARAYAAAGARVVLSSRKQEALDEAAERIRAEGGQALPIAAHVGDPEAVAALMAKTIEAYGGIDILVNNAAINPHFGPMLSAEDSQWEKILDVNLVGGFRAIKACVESMRQRGGGKIVNVTSITGIKAHPVLGVYSVSKAGLIMMTRVLAIELAVDNIQVNALAPGLIKTRFTQLFWSTPMVNEALLRHIPQGRMGQVKEVTGMALYLASPASDFTTGGVFVVDGGHTAGVSIESLGE
jgi:NAD(P)-dependent dehydrogenase (short-subunit alcohol dehydrogenase family)